MPSLLAYFLPSLISDRRAVHGTRSPTQQAVQIQKWNADSLAVDALTRSAYDQPFSRSSFPYQQFRISGTIGTGRSEQGCENVNFLADNPDDRNFLGCFSKILQISLADGAMVLALSVVAGEEMDILAQLGDDSTLDVVREFLAMGSVERSPLDHSGYEPAVWRISPSHQQWIPLFYNVEKVGYLVLVYQAPREWSTAVAQGLQRAISELAFYVAMRHSRLQAQLFRSLVDQSLDAIAVLDDQGRIVYANQAQASLFHLPHDRLLIGRRLDNLMPGIQLSFSQRGTERERLQPQDVPIPQAQGEPLWVSSHLFPVTLSDDVRYWAVIHREITHQKKLLNQIEQNNQALRETNERLNQAQVTQRAFLAMVTHELKTPLHLMLGAVDTVMRKSPQSDPDLQEMLSILSDSAVHLQGVIEDLLTLTRLQTGSLTLSPESVDIVHEVRQCLRLWHQNERRIEFRADEEAIPIITADPLRLRQIFNNLLANATAHCEQVVTVSVACRQQFVVVSVTNDGETVAESYREKIFEPFFRGTKRSGGGMGLGLAVARGLAESHHGVLTLVTDRKRAGTTFELCLPFNNGSARALYEFEREE